MSKSDEMRRLIDLANGNSKAPIVEHDDRGSPTANFNRWGDLSEGWDEGFPRHDDPVEVTVWQDMDPLGEGKWFWSKARGGHTFARGGDCFSEEEARQAAGGLEEDEAGMSMVGEDDMPVTAEVLDETSHLMHLMRPRGGSECGSACDEDNCSPEINDVTCPECLKGHDDFMKRFEFSDEGELDEEAESYLDRMYAAHLKADGGFNYHTNKALEEDDEDGDSFNMPLEEDMPNHEALKRDLEHAVTRYDRRQANNVRNRSYNPNALAIYLRRVDDIVADVEGGMDWRDAVTKGFTDRLRDFVLSYMEQHGHLAEGADLMHYEMDHQEHMGAKGGGYVDPSRYREGHRDYHPEMLCRTGDGHAKGTRNKGAVTCPACLAKL